MGLALLRSRYLDVEARQLAVWDSGPAHGEAGTAVDVGLGNGGAAPSRSCRPRRRSRRVLGPGAAARTRASPGRVVRAMLFADVRGFSKLTDEQLPAFATHVLGTFAEVLHRHGQRVLHRNTWGDALYAVLTDVVGSATCALELQDAMAALDLERLGLPGHLALRLGAHVGPVFPVQDPVLEAPRSWAHT